MKISNIYILHNIFAHYSITDLEIMKPVFIGYV